MSSMIFAISYFYVKNTYDNFEIEMEKFVEEYYLDKRKTLKKDRLTRMSINLSKFTIKRILCRWRLTG